MTTAQVASQIIADVERLMKERPGPAVVLIGGPPAAGKTTLCEAVKERLGEDAVAVLCDDRELYSRGVRDELGMNGIDQGARDMQQLKADLASFVGGAPIANKTYDRSEPGNPEVRTFGLLQPRPVVLLDGFSWCYDDFVGMWDLKYVFLPHSFSDSEKMSVVRDLDERSYNAAEAESKHNLAYRTYKENIDKVRQGAHRIYRVSAQHEFTAER